MTEGRYHLTIRGASIGGSDGHLFAFLLPDPKVNQEWFITPVPQYGPNSYMYTAQPPNFVHY